MLLIHSCVGRGALDRLDLRVFRRRNVTCLQVPVENLVYSSSINWFGRTGGVGAGVRMVHRWLLRRNGDEGTFFWVDRVRISIFGIRFLVRSLGRGRQRQSSRCQSGQWPPTMGERTVRSMRCRMHDTLTPSSNTLHTCS